jgi:6-phospho-beta-glucosidase
VPTIRKEDGDLPVKITIVGGAGVRTPLFMQALVRWAPDLGLNTVTLMDRDEEKLDLIGALCGEVVRLAGSPFALEHTTDLRQALTGADFVVTTIRVGEEAGRVLDERIALKHGVLGQETTGPGGFAMALRSIPAILECADLMAEICPAAWLINFTNPAGLVTQAITAARPAMRIAGICDAPPSMLRNTARALGQRTEDLTFDLFGLNHLSWIAAARLDGEDLLPRLLADDALLASMPELPFEPALLRLLGLIPNEYLYYFYYRERAVANIGRASETRAEQIQRLSAALLGDLREADPRRNPSRGLSLLHQYLHTRSGSYMSAETGGTMDTGVDSIAHAEQSDGYAGVALAVIRAVTAGDRPRIVLNTPNRGVLAGLEDDDVIEAFCTVDQTGVIPLPVGTVPDHAMALIRDVKRYERLTVAAIAQRSRDLAVMALMAHPLVGSYSLATSLVTDYLAAHRPYVGEWR